MRDLGHVHAWHCLRDAFFDLRSDVTEQKKSVPTVSDRQDQTIVVVGPLLIRTITKDIDRNLFLMGQ